MASNYLDLRVRKFKKFQEKEASNAIISFIRLKAGKRLIKK
jgi:hypothetical protein